MERLGGLNGTGFELGNPDLFDRGLLFDELGHRYYFPNESGVKFISVTQFIGLFFEKFDGWATALSARILRVSPVQIQSGFLPEGRSLQVPSVDP